MKHHLKHLYKMRFIPGLLLAAPGLLLIVGLLGESLIRQSDYRQTVQEKADWSIKLMQLSLHDVLQQNKQRLSVKFQKRAQKQNLPVLDFALTQKNLQRLLNSHNKEDYAKAILSHTGHALNVKLRQRGDKHWHKISNKKSLKVRLKKGDFFEGNRNFNLSNPHRPYLIADQLILTIADEIGLLTTDSLFVRVRLNGLNQGVFDYQTRPEELTLRKHNRFPGSIYTLDHLSGKKQIQAWQTASQWEQLSGADFQPMRLDLRDLLSHVASSEYNTFREFALNTVNLEAFAKLEVLNIFFGEEQSQNFALYFDHYKGLWEPILYETDAFHHQEKISLASNPLFQALNKLPEYPYLKQTVFEQLKKKASPQQIQTRSDALINNILPELSQDPDWQATKQLPAINTYYRQMLRPMRPQLLQATAQREIKTYQQRFHWLEQHFVQDIAAPQHQKIEDIYWGPGPINITQTQRFNAHQRVWVKAGTTITMSPGTSLHFRGPVYFEGQANAPIVIQTQFKNQSQRWGGIALQGQGTKGSRFEYVHISGGSAPTDEAISYPGMINIHDSQNIRLNNTLFQDNHGSDDLLHMVYVDDFQANNNRVVSAFSDAWDLEFSRGEIDNLQVMGAGDDGLDLMDSTIKLSSSQLIQCQGNAISVGEESHLSLQNSLLAASGTGLLSKHASHAQVLNSLSYGNQQGLELNQISPNYPGASRINGKEFYLLNNQKQTRLDSTSQAFLNLATAKNILSTSDLAQQNALLSLQQQLGLSHWSEFEIWLTEHLIIGQKQEKQ